MNESEKRFSFTTRSASTSGRAKKQILISVILAAVIVLLGCAPTLLLGKLLEAVKTAGF